jgi:uncharacterized membrane protein YeaQ/YmgE (transglycosylase-associated protein family)
MNILVLALLIVVFELAVPFWAWIAALPFACGLVFGKSCRRAAWRGASAGGLSWLGASLYLYISSGRIIAGRIAAMFGLGRDRGWLMVIATGLLGAIIAGLAAYAGASLREALRGKGPLATQSAAVKKQ